MDFVNELGYPEEEFVQVMQTFLTDKANLGSPTKKGRKDKPYVIPYCQFMKLIICQLGRIHNIHQRSASSFHLAEEDLRLGNLKFVSKGKIDEVWNALLVDGFAILTKDFFREWNDLFIPFIRYKVGKVRIKSKNKGIVPTEMELVLEQTQQGSSHEVSLVDIEKVAVRSSLRSLKPKRTLKSRAKRSSINIIRTLFHITCSSHNVKKRIIIRVLRIILVVFPEHSSDTYMFTMKMEILLEPTSSKLMVGKLGESDVHTLEDPTLILEILSRRFFLTLNLPDHRFKLRWRWRYLVPVESIS
ncbi:hypothetical protein Tco_1185053 [Tanacetum coccineum]